jgi:DNA polymerase epsilon subunit 3
MQEKENQSIEEFDLPKTIINRVLKTKLPEGALFQKDAKIAFSKSGTVFINFITTLALDLAKQSNLKTLTPELIYKALEISDFEGFIPKIKELLLEHKESLKLKKLKKQEKDSDQGPETPVADQEPETPLDSYSVNDEDSVIIQKS